MDRYGAIQIFLLLFIATRDHIQCSWKNVFGLLLWEVHVIKYLHVCDIVCERMSGPEAEPRHFPYKFSIILSV